MDKPSMPKVKSYDVGRCAAFRRTSDPWGALSNMVSGFPIFAGGISLCASEVLYQACRYPHLPDLQQELLLSQTPFEAKLTSRSNARNSRPDWETVRVAVMTWCLRVKLAQHYEALTGILRATGNLEIVERTRDDIFWGAAPSGDQLTYVGRNVLGRLWSLLRRDVKRKPAVSMRRVEPPQVPRFLLLGREVGIISACSPTGAPGRVR